MTDFGAESNEPAQLKKTSWNLDHLAVAIYPGDINNKSGNVES